MADSNRARHAFGSSSSIEEAKQANKIDAFDILFLDGDTNNPKIGWLDSQGNTVIVQDKEQIIRVDELPTTDGDENVVYIYNNEGYTWDGTQCVPLAKTADLSALEAEIATKISADEVDAKIETAISEAVSVEVVEF